MYPQSVEPGRSFLFLPQAWRRLIDAVGAGDVVTFHDLTVLGIGASDQIGFLLSVFV